eukprot:3347553-Rhodomonas_salina.1
MGKEKKKAHAALELEAGRWNLVGGDGGDDGLEVSHTGSSPTDVSSRRQLPTPATASTQHRAQD